ncbi:alcohol dehydrogenase catalytic domain-containing protein [Methanobrevibacter sp. OttesenSCG-928-K11]|nr:alcohol dehydrogenase catalytic domain-containing protein [Methanobrevibacter sp. OttesenSCG-928-K11]MDL2270345.1 alcohol dehydrogenase catalytic domain-containing protein [Methanobrevibacter sp. OttesenSCG-928-I08]
MINNVYRLKSPKLFDKVYTEIDINSDIIARPTYLSICKADQRYYQGERESEILDEKLPMALIHEGIGKIIKDNSYEFKPGDNVIFIPNNPTDSDEYISSNYLKSSKFKGSSEDGFTSDLISFKKDRILKLPDNFNLETSAFLELVSVAIHGINKFKKIAHNKKDVLGVWGDGNMGFIVSLLLKNIFPDSKIIVFGKHFENLNRFSFVDEVYKINEIPENLAIDHGFECVGSAASQKAINQIINLSNPEATISLFGVSEYPVSINTRLILEKGLIFFGISRSEREDFIEVINLLNAKPEIISYLNNLITEVIEVRSLKDLTNAFEKDYKNSFGKTVLKWMI